MNKKEKILQKIKERNDKRGASPLETWVQQWMPLAHLYGYVTEHQVDHFFLDIAWPGIKVAVELDGWQFHKNRKEQDNNRDRYLQKKGWTVIRIPSREAWNPKKLAWQLKRIHEAVSPDNPISYGLAELLGTEDNIRKPRIEADPLFNCKACDLPIHHGEYCSVCRGVYL